MSFGDIMACLAIVGVVIAVVSAFSMVKSAIGEDRFGLKFVSSSEDVYSYAGDVDGARVEVRGSERDWTVTVALEAVDGVDLFAHVPTFSFDRPLKALFGLQKRLAVPDAYGGGWAFYGNANAALAAPLLTAPNPSWNRVELSGGALQITLRPSGKLSLERIQGEIPAVRAARDAVAKKL